MVTTLNEPGALGVIATTIGENGANIDNVVFNPGGIGLPRIALRPASVRHPAPQRDPRAIARQERRRQGRAAERLTETRSLAMPLYFAYGSNMDVEAMARRCPRSKPLGLARLDAPSARDHARRLADGDARSPMRTSTACCGTSRSPTCARSTATRGSPTGLYAKALQPVSASAARNRRWSISAPNSGPGVAAADYIAGVLAAARHWRLPAATIARLESFAAEAGVAPPAAPAERRPRPARAAALRHAVRPGVIDAPAQARSPTAPTTAPRRRKSSCPRGRACSR